MDRQYYVNVVTFCTLKRGYLHPFLDNLAKICNNFEIVVVNIC